MAERGHRDGQVGEDEAEVLTREAEAAGRQVAEAAGDVAGSQGGEFPGAAAELVLLDADVVPAFDHPAAFAAAADPAFGVGVGFADRGAGCFVHRWGWSCFPGKDV